MCALIVPKKFRKTKNNSSKELQQKENSSKVFLVKYRHLTLTNIVFPHLPEFDGFVICGEQKLSAVSCLVPSNLVDFLLNFQALEIVKLNSIISKSRVGSTLKTKKRKVI